MDAAGGMAWTKQGIEAMGSTTIERQSRGPEKHMLAYGQITDADERVRTHLAEQVLAAV
jgi:hypothetical protein